MKSSYQIIVDDRFEFESTSLEELDAIPNGEERFHILQGNKAFHAEVLEKNASERTYTIRVNGTTHTVKIQDAYDLLVKKLGFSVSGELQVKDIKAPMPGLVLKISVEEGQAVEKGNALLILEAMKMENIIKAPGSGIVKEIRISEGQAVDKGQLLIEME